MESLITAVCSFVRIHVANPTSVTITYPMLVPLKYPYHTNMFEALETAFYYFWRKTATIGFRIFVTNFEDELKEQDESVKTGGGLQWDHREVESMRIQHKCLHESTRMRQQQSLEQLPWVKERGKTENHKFRTSEYPPVFSSYNRLSERQLGRKPTPLDSDILTFVDTLNHERNEAVSTSFLALPVTDHMLSWSSRSSAEENILPRPRKMREPISDNSMRKRESKALCLSSMNTVDDNVARLTERTISEPSSAVASIRQSVSDLPTSAVQALSAELKTDLATFQVEPFMRAWGPLDKKKRENPFSSNNCNAIEVYGCEMNSDQTVDNATSSAVRSIRKSNGCFDINADCWRCIGYQRLCGEEINPVSTHVPDRRIDYAKDPVSADGEYL